MRMFMIAVSLIVPVAAHAAPVSLKCQVEASSWEYVFQLDESQSTAVYTTPGGTQQRRALFTPELVTIVGLNQNSNSLVFRINRVNLTLERAMTIGTSPTTIDRGTCALYQLPKRAF